MIDRTGKTWIGCVLLLDVEGMDMLLWILAVILVVIGLVQVLQGQLILGIVILAAAALIGPGGYSIFGRRRSV